MSESISPYAGKKGNGPLNIHKTPGYRLEGNRVVWFNPLVYKPSVDLLKIQRVQNRVKGKNIFPISLERLPPFKYST